MFTHTLDALDSDEIQKVLDECVLMKKIEHPNILELLGVCFNSEENVPYIVLPFMANGDLKHTFIIKELQVFLF